MRRFLSKCKIGSNYFITPIWLLTCFWLCGCTQKSEPKISFDPESLNLGKVEEGIEIKAAFSITNQGNAELKIFDAHSSCGCTVPTLQKSRLSPGESTKLDIMVDTSMKQGEVTKHIEVSSNDPKSPLVSLPIELEVKNRHTGLSESGKSKIFTDEKCTSCHVDRGVGLAGKELFEADCAMCHGEDAKGAVGGALVYGDFDNPAYRKHINDVICYGSKTHRSMPGFLDRSGGPLIREQVDSLIDYLADLSRKEREKRQKTKVEDHGSKQD